MPPASSLCVAGSEHRRLPQRHRETWRISRFKLSIQIKQSLQFAPNNRIQFIPDSRHTVISEAKARAMLTRFRAILRLEYISSFLRPWAYLGWQCRNSSPWLLIGANLQASIISDVHGNSEDDIVCKLCLLCQDVLCCLLATWPREQLVTTPSALLLHDLGRYPAIRCRAEDTVARG